MNRFTHFARIARMMLAGALLVGVAFVMGAGEAAYAATGGPDGYGYEFTDSTEPGFVNPAGGFIDISGTGTPVSLGDDASSSSIPIGFDVTFYGTTDTHVNIASNGYMWLANQGFASSADYSNVSLPESGYTLVYYPLWDDLNPPQGGMIYYETQGTAPTRRFIVQWDGVPRFFDTGAVTFQVVLFEDSDDILFQYADVDFGDPGYDGGASATVGIQGDDIGSNHLEYSYDTASLSDGLAILFTPPMEIAEEGPTSDTYDLVLDQAPTGPVTVNITTDGECWVSPTQVIFPTTSGSGGWNDPRTITVTAIDDADVEGDHTCTITNSYVSTDTYYNGVTTNKTALVTDNDLASLVCSYTDSNDAGFAYPPGVTGFVDISGTGTDLLLGDDDNDEVFLPFSVSYFGVTDNAVWIESNGYMWLSNQGAADGRDFSNEPLPEPDGTLVYVPFWDDLDPSASGAVYYEIQGTAPNRLFIVQWNDVTYYSGSGGVTFQVILFEGTTDVLFQYNDVSFGGGGHDNGVSATVGFQRDPATALQYSYNAASLFNGLAIRFTCIPPALINTVLDDGLVVAEEGPTSDTYTVVLTVAPTDPVTVDITTDGECTVLPTQVIFPTTSGAGGWDDPRTITVTAVDDTDVEGPHTCTITHTASSVDTNYDALTRDIIANVEDNDVATPGGGDGGGAPAAYDPAVSKRGSPLNAAVGETVTWTLTIWNPHSEAIGGVVINDPIPAMFDIIDVETPVGTATVDGQVVTITVPSLAPGQSFEVTITTVANELATAGEVCNTVYAGAASAEACIMIYPGMLPETGSEPVGALWWGAGAAALAGAGVGGYILFRRRRSQAAGQE